jgi:hypothetical protein
MSSAQPVMRDERTAAVENAAFKWGYYILYFGLLIDCLYRHRVRHEDIGDLIVVLGVSVAFLSVYLIRHKAAEPLTWRKFLVVYAFGLFWAALFCASW